MRCTDCGLIWDLNDESPPECNRGVSVTIAVNPKTEKESPMIPPGKHLSQMTVADLCAVLVHSPKLENRRYVDGVMHVGVADAAKVFHELLLTQVSVRRHERPVGTVEGGLWRHYKGGIYRVLHAARDADTGEPVVVYMDIGTGQVYVRPQSVWSEFVTDARGNHGPRFSRHA